MADPKQQYPIRLDISKQGPATVAPPMPQSAARTVGGGVRRAASAVADVGSFVANAPVAIARQIGAVPAIQRGASEFAEGLLGLTPGALTDNAAKMTTKAAPKAEAKKPTAAAKVRPEPTNEDLAAAMLAAELSSPRSFKRAMTAIEHMPAPRKPQTAKDAAYGLYAQEAERQYGNALAQVEAIRKANPQEAANLERAASKEFLARISGVLGNDGLQLALPEPE